MTLGLTAFRRRSAVSQGLLPSSLVACVMPHHRQRRLRRVSHAKGSRTVAIEYFLQRRRPARLLLVFRVGVLLGLFGVFSGAAAAVGDKNFGTPPVGCAGKLAGFLKSRANCAALLPDAGSAS